MPGTHHAVIDKNGIAWISENWAHQLNRLDPKTGEVKQVLIASKTPINAPSFGNFTLDAEGFVWDARADRVAKMDPETGKVVQEWPLQANSSYDNTISYDGRYWGGSGPANWGNTVEMLDIETGKMAEFEQRRSHDDRETRRVRSLRKYLVGRSGWRSDRAQCRRPPELKNTCRRLPRIPTPISTKPCRTKTARCGPACCTAGRCFGSIPRPAVGAAYQMPEPYSYDRRTYIDASTHPVTVWYVDYNGYLVRVQPLD